MAAWRVVNSITTLRLQLDAAFPGRSHASDGTIADDKHSRTSDHYPHDYPALGPTPVVCAFDGTHDPAHGCDNNEITEAMRESRDGRIKYVIWNRQMYSSYASSGHPPWSWRPYTGSDDPHTEHFHVSVVAAPIADDTSPWQIGVTMSTHVDAIIERWASGLATDDKGQVIAPVVWRQRDEKWQERITEMLNQGVQVDIDLDALA